MTNDSICVTEEISSLYEMEEVELFKINYDFVNLLKLSLELDDEISNKKDDEDNNMAISVSKGEKTPLAVRVDPASEEYSDFTINSEGTHVTVYNNLGVEIAIHGDLSIDSVNKTVVFSWDTSKYAVGSYSIIFWISVTYNETNFLIKSNTINKSIRKSSLLE